MDNKLKVDSTEEKILGAAKKVFIRKGMYGARMQEIADEAGINKALLHYYFRSKNKLFEAIFQETFKEFVPRAFSILQAEIPFEEKIEKFVSNYIDVVSENPFMPIFIINEINQKPERLSDITNMMSVIKTEISTDLNEKFRSGEYRKIDPVQLFSSVISMTLFPFLAKPIIQGAFNYSDEKFSKFLEERKKLIPEIILSYLKSNN
jgi:AcrR family transcriptional regulator